MPRFYTQSALVSLVLITPCLFASHLVLFLPQSLVLLPRAPDSVPLMPILLGLLLPPPRTRSFTALPAAYATVLWKIHRDQESRSSQTLRLQTRFYIINDCKALYPDERSIRMLFPIDLDLCLLTPLSDGKVILQLDFGSTGP